MPSSSRAGTLQSHLTGQRHSPTKHIFGKPDRGLSRTRRHGRQRHLLIVIVEYFEAIVATVADALEPQHEIGQRTAVHTFAGEDTEMARGGDTLFERANFLPHEIG